MIEIALCDDSVDDILKLQSFTQRFADLHSEVPIRLRAFLSSEELLEHLENNSGFDLYILDVVMPGISGIQLAEKIRERGERAEIIFMTVSREYAVDAFSVRASGYLIKPVNREDFDKELLGCIERLIPRESATLTVKTKEGIRRVHLHSIVMIESFNHTRVLTMSDGSILETPSTLSELYDRLSSHSCFYMPHRAYIVNLDYSTGLKRYELLMAGNRQIPIPRKQFVAVEEAFANHFSK